MEEDRTPNIPPQGTNRRSMRTRSTPRPTSASLETPNSWASGVTNNNKVSSLSGRRPPLHTGGSVSSAHGSTPRRSARIATSNKQASLKRPPSPSSSSSPSKKRKPSSSSPAKKRKASSSPAKNKAASEPIFNEYGMEISPFTNGPRQGITMAVCKEIVEVLTKNPTRRSFKSKVTGKEVKELQKYTPAPVGHLGLPKDCSVFYGGRKNLPIDHPNFDEVLKGLVEERMMANNMDRIILNSKDKADGKLQEKVRGMVKRKYDVDNKKLGPIVKNVIRSRRARLKEEELSKQAANAPAVQVDALTQGGGGGGGDGTAGPQEGNMGVANSENGQNAPAVDALTQGGGGGDGSAGTQEGSDTGVANSESERLAGLMCTLAEHHQATSQRFEEQNHQIQAQIQQGHLQFQQGQRLQQEQNQLQQEQYRQTQESLRTMMKTHERSEERNLARFERVDATLDTHQGEIKALQETSADQASQIAILQDQVTSVQKVWNSYERRMNESVRMSRRRLFDVDLDDIATQQVPNFLGGSLEKKMKLVKDNPEAFSEHHRKVLQTFQKNEDMNNEDAKDGLEGTECWFLKKDVSVSSLVDMDGFADLHQQLEPDDQSGSGAKVIVVPSSANSQEQVYILPDETDWFVQGVALHADGGTLHEFGLTVNDKTIWIYAPSVEAATPAFTALVELAMKRNDDATLALVSGWADSGKSERIDLPLQAIEIGRPVKKLVVEKFKILPGQEETLMACATEISFQECGEVSEEVSNALVREALKTTHLEKIHFRSTKIVLTPETTKELLAGLEQRAQGPCPLVVDFSAIAWDRTNLNLLVGKFQEALETGQSMSYMEFECELIAQAPLKGTLKNVIQETLEKLGKDHQVAKKVLDEGWIPLTLFGTTAKKVKVQDLVKKWAAQVHASANEKGPAATTQGAARSPFTTSGEN